MLDDIDEGPTPNFFGMSDLRSMRPKSDLGFWEDSAQYFDRARRSMFYNETAIGEFASMREAYRRHGKIVKDAIGVDLDAPTSNNSLLVSSPADLADRSEFDAFVREQQAQGSSRTEFDLFSEWKHRKYWMQLEELAQKHPDKRDLIIPKKRFDQQAIDIRNEALKRFENVSNSHNLGAFAAVPYIGGSMAAMFQDPTNVVQMLPFFAGAPPGAIGLLTQFAKIAGISAVGEAAIQPQVQAAKMRAGQDYGWGDALTSVGMAAALGGSLDVGPRIALRQIMPMFGYRPKLDKGGNIDGWTKIPRTKSGQEIPQADLPPIMRQMAGQGDAEAQNEALRRVDLASREDPGYVPGDLVRRVEQGDEGAARELIERMRADATPQERGLIDGIDADGRLALKPSDRVNAADHAEALLQGFRAVNDPREPPPIVVRDTPEPVGIVKQLEDQLTDLRAKADADRAKPDMAVIQRIRAIEDQLRLFKGLSGDPIAAARAVKDTPAVEGELPLHLPTMELARDLSRLSDEAFDMVERGEAAPELGQLVSRYVADPAEHARVLSLLAAMRPRNLDEARQTLADILTAPPREAPAPRGDIQDGAVVEPKSKAAEEPSGANETLIDDPYGPEAKAQLDALRERYDPEAAQAKTEGDAPKADTTGQNRTEADTPRTPEEAVQRIFDRATEVFEAIGEVMGIVPRQTRVRTFTHLSDLPEHIAAQVLEANSRLFAQALDMFQRATTLEQRAEARALLDRASMQRGIEGISADDTIWIATYAQNPKGRVAHEVVHALVKNGQLAPEELAVLAAAARKEGHFSAAQEAAYRREFEGRTGKYKMTAEQIRQKLDEEAAAHLIEARQNGIGPQPTPRVEGILQRLSNFFERVRNALTGRGFKTAEDLRASSISEPWNPDPTESVVDAILTGNAASQLSVDVWKRSNDVKSFAIDERGPEPVMFVIAGEKSKTADLQALDLAKRMARPGMYDKAKMAIDWIKKTTGTDPLQTHGYRDDADYVFLAEGMGMPPIPDAAVPKGPRATKEEIFKATGWWRGADGMWRYEISDRPAAWLGETFWTAKPGSETSLWMPNFVGHDELFKAYPHLINVAMKVDRSAFGIPTTLGSADPREGGAMTLNLHPGYEPLSTALHEAQHFIQFREGFDRGGNQGSGARLYNDLAQQVMEIFQEMASEPDPDARQILRDQVGMIRDAMDRIGGNSFDIYQRISGEVEARLVQRRMELTPEERRQYMPWEEGPYGPDVPLKDQLVQVNELYTPLMYAIRMGSDRPGEGVAQTNMHGFAPYLRVRIKKELQRVGKALFVQETNNKNAPRQIEALSSLAAEHPDPASSTDAWAKMMAQALGGHDIPMPPYGLIKELNDGSIVTALSRLTVGQLADANHGFKNADEFLKLYTSGRVSVSDTARLFLWSFLSKGVSPYTQESLFIDAFRGIDQWIDLAVAGKFTEDLIGENGAYTQWAKSAAGKGTGLPGAGATHNLTGFGRDFLVKMSLPVEEGSTKSRLQHLHEMLSNPAMTGKQIRREFLKFGEGVGIDNKVVSFTLLVTGRTDVMVLDRVQIKRLFDDGRFKGINLYDGDGTEGSALSNLTYGARGLVVYEAIERSVEKRLQQIYAEIGRPGDASLGRYHWETWVEASGQEASHGTLDAILRQAMKDNAPLDGVYAKEGEYARFAYSTRYGRDADGNPHFLYDTSNGTTYKFTPDAYRDFISEVKKPGNKVIASKFKLSEEAYVGQPWFTRPDVDRGVLDALAARFGKQFGSQPSLFKPDEAPLPVGSRSAPAPQRGGGADFAIAGPQRQQQSEQPKGVFEQLAEAIGRLLEIRQRPDTPEFVRSEAGSVDEVVKGGQRFAVQRNGDGLIESLSLTEDMIGNAQTGLQRAAADAAQNLLENIGPEGAAEALVRVMPDLVDRLSMMDMEAFGRAMPEILSGMSPAQATQLAQAVPQQGADGAMFAMVPLRRQERYAGYQAMQRAAELQRLRLLQAMNPQMPLAERMQQERVAMLGFRSLEANLAKLAQWRDPVGRANPGRALLYILEHSGEAPWISAAVLRKTIHMEAVRRIEAAMWEFRKGAILGDLRRTRTIFQARSENIVLEMGGVNTGDATAAAMARSINDVFEYLRRRFNAAGGDIGRLQNYIMPQSHDPEMLIRMGKRAWLDYMTTPGRLDINRMIDPLTGAPYTPDRLREMLGVAFDNITTNGAFTRDINYTGQGPGQALYNRHAEHRVIHFANAREWLDYQRNVNGRNDFFGSILDHIDMMARDISLMETLGPNPRLTLDRLKEAILKDVEIEPIVASRFDEVTEAIDRLQQLGVPIPNRVATMITDIRRLLTELDRLSELRVSRDVTNQVDQVQAQLSTARQQLFSALHPGAVTPQQQNILVQINRMIGELSEADIFYRTTITKDATGVAKGYLARVDDVFGLMSGSTNVPVNGAWAGGLSATRNWLSASMLIYAPFTSVTDHLTASLARAFVGMPVIRHLSSFLTALGNEDKRFAVHLGLGLDQVAHAFHTEARFGFVHNTRHFTGWVADRSHTFSFLAPMSQAIKTAFGIDFMRWMASQQGTAWADLSNVTREMFERAGMGEAEWNRIRTAAPTMRNGVGYLSGSNITQAVGRDLGERYMAMLFTEMSHALIEPGARARSILIGSNRPGTLWGELARSIAMLKSFPVTYTMTTLGRVMHDIQSGHGGRAAGYAIALVFGGTILGALQMQPRAWLQGRDSEKVDEVGFWARAFLSSGGLGIFGDFVGNAVNRFNRNPLEALLGPTLQTGSALLDLTVGTLFQAIAQQGFGSDVKIRWGQKAADFARTTTPGMIAPWYVRTAYERLILSTAHKLIDPEADRSYRDAMRRMRQRTGSGMWWPLGRPFPEREPDFSLFSP